jgi:membrane-bound lytic murein transglycosylase B
VPNRTRLTLTIALLLPCLSAMAQDLSDFKAEIRSAAQAAGVSDQTVDASLRGFQPIERVIELDRKQPEHTITFDTYIGRVVSDSRIQRGQELLAENRPLLSRIEQDYGVSPSILVALWGAESSFGSSMGDYRIIPALATLSYEGRRHDFFKGELIKAMQIVDAGDVTLDDMTGSWAGAMGQVQFMPSTFLSYAVDYTGSGRRDIWHSDADALASGANFLEHLGWKRGELWGREVMLPPRFDADLAKPDNLQTVGTWSSLGLTVPDGSRLPESEMMASVVLPDGPGGRAFLAYDNFRVIMRWNHSTYFATSIGLLSNAIEGRR